MTIPLIRLEEQTGNPIVMEDRIPNVVKRHGFSAVIKKFDKPDFEVYHDDITRTLRAMGDCQTETSLDAFTKGFNLFPDSSDKHHVLESVILTYSKAMHGAMQSKGARRDGPG